jgi:general secretion pathway protein G
MKPRFSFRLKLSHGFTIVELLVVMAIMGILAAAIMPLGEAMLKAQKERELKQALWEIRSAIDEYKRASDQGAFRQGQVEIGYPPNLRALTAGVADARTTTGQQLYFLRQIPRDPFAPPDIEAEQTWRLRSYGSPSDKPAPGADVYDIRSSSDEISMDGTPYAKW